ncbi:MAG: hypothetical protein RL358_602 [Pseudomonadota bacterium]
MSHHSTVLSQLLKLIPRHEFQALSEQHDTKRRIGALSRWGVPMSRWTISSSSPCSDGCISVVPTVHPSRVLRLALP